jgi:hypothetical protein
MDKETVLHLYFLEVKMYSTKTLNHNFATIGEGALLIWWGVVIMVDPLTLGMGAIGTGLILLGVNAARLLSHIRIRRTTNVFGIITLAWGILDTVFHPRFGASFALLLIVIGSVTISSLLARPKKE